MPLNLTENAVLLIMPRSSRAWAGAEALWITAAGWAAAARRKYGTAWVVTQDRIATPEEVLGYPLGPVGAVGPKKSRLSWIPVFLNTWVKDILLLWRSRNWGIIDAAPWRDHRVAFIWEQHDLFAGPGRKLARQLGVPLVKYVHAPVVWESARWGVKRYLWGWFLERYVEAPALRRADLVACVSDEVARKVRQLGVLASRIVVSPMAVDEQLFAKAEVGRLPSKPWGEKGLVVGWTGSFRSFHGLDSLVLAFGRVLGAIPAAQLVLVGDGFERPGLEERVRELGLQDSVWFVGRKPFAEIPGYVMHFDVAIVSARAAADFHYSPLKLREYLAAGCAVVAPRAGDLPFQFNDREQVVFYEAGDPVDLADKMLLVLRDASLRHLLRQNGKATIKTSGTWFHELVTILQKLGRA